MDQPQPRPATNATSAAFFDLDKTIIAKASTLAFSKPFLAGGLISKRTLLRTAYAHFWYLTAGADHNQMERMREYLTSLVIGWDVQQVRDVVTETMEQIIVPYVYKEATALIEEHHAAGRDVIVVSSSACDLVEPIGQLLGADEVIGTKLRVADGKYTGDIDFYAYGPNKGTAVHEVAQRNGYDLKDCFAYSDSFTDVPMLSAVGHPTAVNPDKALRREALAQSWPVMDFSHPVPLRTRVGDRLPPRRSTSAVAIGALALAILVYRTQHRRHHHQA